jgi:hypothetical protein
MAQQAPYGVEHDFAVYGRNPSAKQLETRRKNLADGKPVEKLANRRMVGLLKMIRNMAFAHRSQHVQQGRFNTEDEVHLRMHRVAHTSSMEAGVERHRRLTTNVWPLDTACRCSTTCSSHSPGCS